MTKSSAWMGPRGAWLAPLFLLHMACGNETVVVPDVGAPPNLSDGSTGSAILFDFSTGTDGFTYNNWQSLDSAGKPTGVINLAAPSYLQAGGKMPTLTTDSAEGDPPPAMKAVADFTDYYQNVICTHSFGSGYQNWTNRKIHVRIKAAQWFQAGGGIILAAQDDTWAGSYQWKQPPTDTEWHTYTMDLTGGLLENLNPARVTTFSVFFANGEKPAGGEAAPFTPTTLVAYVDSITVE